MSTLPTDTDNAERPQPRSRVWRACEVCRKRKVKCNGQEPCSYCLSSGKICSFKDSTDNASISRQHANTVDSRLSKVEETLEKLVPMVHAFENWMQSGHPATFPSPSFNPTFHQQKSYAQSPRLLHHSENPIASTSHAEDREYHTPEKWVHATSASRLTNDDYGNLRYTDGTPSAIVVDALTTLRDDPIATSPTPGPDTHPPFFSPHRQFRVHDALPRAEDIAYPPYKLADELVATYFSEIHHVLPIVPQHLFLSRYQSVMDAHAKSRPSSDHAFLSTLFAMFACSACFSEKKNGTESWGMGFYENAQVLFWMGTGSPRIEHVQCLTLLAICNASWNTLDQSWINAGQAIRRAQDLGLHRMLRGEHSSELDKEIRRRVWWCVYGLDKVLSIALGRPSGTYDDDCDTEMPRELDDDDQDTSCIAGFIALSKICAIAGDISRSVNSPHARDITYGDRLRNYEGELARWFHDLPSSIASAASDRKHKNLTMTCLFAFFVYHSTIINLHRPFLQEVPSSVDDFTLLGKCLRAARCCIRIGEIMQEMLPTLHHLAFAVQYITLSGILLLRCAAYVNRTNLLTAIMEDTEKCIKILGDMQSIWLPSKPCRDLVVSLLDVVRSKIQREHPVEVQSQSHLRSLKRKNSVDDNHGGSRKRMYNPIDLAESSFSMTVASPTSMLSGGREDFENLESRTGPSSGSYHQRLSNLRTSVEVEAHQSLDNFSSARGGGMSFDPTEKGQHVTVTTARTPFDARSLEIDGLPFCGYNFIGVDLSAEVMRPMNPDFEENAQLLWQIFNDPGALFSGS